MMKKSIPLLFLLVASLTAHASGGLTHEQEQRVQELVKETLINHPEILIVAAEKLEQQNAQASEERIKQVIIQENDFLFHDKNSPRLGSASPKLTLVLFTDYNCPYCKKFDPYIEKIIKKYPDVAVVYKFLPYRSESSISAARYALTLWRKIHKNSVILIM